MLQNNRKRKGLSSSGPANSTGTGTTVGAPNSQPSTPSTHTAGDGVSMASNVQQAGSMSKGLMTYGSNGLAGLTSSANQLVLVLTHVILVAKNLLLLLSYCQ